MGNLGMEMSELIRAELRHMEADGVILEWRELDGDAFGPQWVVDTGATVSRPMSADAMYGFIYGCHVAMRRRAFGVPSLSSVPPSLNGAPA